jgi:hypothetical protein
VNWLFPSESPLPPGYSLKTLLPRADSLGASRIEFAEKMLGRETARTIARKLGAYEVTEELALRLELEGVQLGPGGEVPLLTPTRWGLFPDAMALQDLLALQGTEGLVLAGLQLSKRQSEVFSAFLSRNPVARDAPMDRVLELAGHFFFGQTINVVVRYTATVRVES